MKVDGGCKGLTEGQWWRGFDGGAVVAKDWRRCNGDTVLKEVRW